MLRTRPRPGFKYDACSKPAALGLDVRQWHILVVSCIVIWIGSSSATRARISDTQCTSSGECEAMYGADIVCGTAGFCKCAPEDYMPVDGQCRHKCVTEARQLHDKDRRTKNYKNTIGEPVVTDHEIKEGWYSLDQYHLMGGAETGDLTGGSCGTKYQIVMKDNSTVSWDTLEHMEVALTATVYGTPKGYSEFIEIRVRKCENSFQYYLKPPKVRLAAYCFDPMVNDSVTQDEADLFLFYYESDSMKDLSNDNQADIIKAFNSTSRYFDDLLNIDNPYFEGMLNQMYLPEMQLNKDPVSFPSDVIVVLDSELHFREELRQGQWFDVPYVIWICKLHVSSYNDIAFPSENQLYKSSWFVDNTRIKSTLPLPVLKNTPDVDRTNVDKEWFIGENITEEELLGAGYSLGVVIRCGVQSSRSITGKLSYMSTVSISTGIGEDVVEYMSANSDNNLLHLYSWTPLGCVAPIGSEENTCILKFQVIQGSGTIACSANLGKADSHELCGHIMTGRTKRGVSAHPDFWSFTQGHYVNENGTTHWMMKGAFVQLASTTGNVKPGAAVHYSLAVTNNTSGHTLWDSYQLHNAMITLVSEPQQLVLNTHVYQRDGVRGLLINKFIELPSGLSLCVLCKTETDEQIVKLGEKGCQGLREASIEKGEQLSVTPGRYVHSECRKRYCHPNQKRTEKEQLAETVIRSPKTRKSCDNKFDYKTSCLFCGTAAKVNHRKRGTDVYFIRTLPILLSIKDVCKSRNDEWGNEVLGRIEYAHDLPAVEARYHQTCSSNLRSGYKIPSKYAQVPNESKRGRPVNARSEETFAEVVRYFEDNQNEQIAVSDLVEKMKELTCSDAYSTVYMKKKLIDHFGDSIFISELDGKANVVTFKSAAHSILNTFYNRQKKNDCESEKTAIIKTAAKLIQSDMKDIGANKEFYPSSDEIVSIESNLKCVPGSLQDFLKHIIENKKSEVKIASIAQAIIQSSISRKVLEPLQISLGVFCHHHFGSKFLIDILNSMGFCSSYQEVQKFESSAAATYGTDFCKTPRQFLQFVGDNVDHNTNTLDGHGSFHGMGIIATLTPKIKQSRHIPRIQATNEDIAKIGKVNIAYYKQPSHAMEMLIFKKLVDSMIDVLEYEACDFILRVARPLRPLYPGWSGYMQAIQTGQFPGQSDMIFLPMIDLNPSDLNCIYSTLRFVTEQAKRVSTVPVVTFDQPLYWKAMTIVSNELQDSDLKSVIVRLGAFHTQISFLGCIGKIMEDSGLKELLSTVYAPNTVGHMLNGKAIWRAIRGHMLVHDALNKLLLEKTFPFLHNDNCKQVGASDDDTEVEISDRDENNNSVAHVDNETEASNSSETGLKRLVNLYDKLMAKEVSPNEVISNPDIDKTKDELQKTKISLSNCRTAQLWLLYLELIDLLKRFIAAERTGNWKSHLKTLHAMLPFFGAAGHNLYLKSAYVYLQQMLMLPQNSPLLYETFLQGGHVMRRSDRYWAGLSSDLIIEQVLMRSVKVNGGLTRGRGLSETQRALWVLSMPACADISNSLQEFTGEKYVSSDQHVEASITRIERDTKDRHTIISFLRERNPFASDDSQLRNIETGAVADTKVNVDRAKIIGQSIFRGKVDKKVTDYTFKRTDQVVTLGSKNSVNVGSDQISIDPQILFQRLIAISDDTLDDTEEIFKYELSSQPSSLFDSSGLLREAQKPKISSCNMGKGRLQWG